MGIRTGVWVPSAGVWVLVTGTRLHVKTAASMLPVLDVSSPQLDDKHTDLLHPICDVRFSGPGARAQWRCHHGPSWHVSSQHGTRHAVHGTDGSHSRV